jgi:hypothetical protein
LGRSKRRTQFGDCSPSLARRASVRYKSLRYPRTIAFDGLSRDDIRMDSENPYASPRYTPSYAGAEKPAIDAATIHGARRYGKYLIVRRDAELPALCATCGLPANGPLRKWKLKWTDIWKLRYWATVTPSLAGVAILLVDESWYSWILFFGLGLLSGWMGHRFVQRTTAFYRLCERHETKRRRMPCFAALFASIGATGFLAAMVLGVTANYSDAMVVLGVIAAVGWVLAIFCAARMGATVEAYRIEGDLVWLKGMPHAFLAQIPEISAAELSDWAKTAPQTGR